jgi:hypothetical protein
VPGALGLGPDEGRDKVSSPTPIARMHRADSTHGIDKIVLDNRIRCHCNLVTDAEVQVDRPGRAVLADLETPEYHAQREYDLAETLVLAIRPILMVDLSSAPAKKILKEMILEGGVQSMGSAKFLIFGRGARYS